MAKQNKTTETKGSVTAFLNSITEKSQREDATALADLMAAQTGFEAKMWGSAIIGFGTRHYVYDSGREGDMPLVAFSPRKAAMVLYLSTEIAGREELLLQLGKHKTGKGCLYIKALSDVNIPVLKKLIKLTAKARAQKSS